MKEPLNNNYNSYNSVDVTSIGHKEEHDSVLLLAILIGSWGFGVLAGAAFADIFFPSRSKF